MKAANMKVLRIIVASLALSMLWACSQTVSGSDKDSRSDDSLPLVPGYHPADGNGSTKGSSANGGIGSSSSKGGGLSSSAEIYPDDGGPSSSESSGLDVTKYLPDQKMDCKFSLEDDEWRFQTVEADSTVDITLDFKDNGDLWVDITSEAPAESKEACEESVELINFIGMMAAASDETDMKMSASCDGSMFSMKVQGTADEKYTPEQKREMYSNMCK